MNRKARVVAVAVLLLSSWPVAPARADEDPWADFRFLIGSWVSDGKPEKGSGHFTLEPDLGGKVLVRRHIAILPATKGRPAGKHEDLMVVYREPASKRLRVSYFDNEGHVIQYAVSALPDKKGVVFLSDAAPSAPQFRLTYTKAEGDKVAVKFEIAPPGKADKFRTYLEGSVRRKKPAESK
jgi:hypothetical protein